MGRARSSASLRPRDLTTLHDFDNGGQFSNLLAGNDGNLYGTTEDDGVLGVGLVFEVTPAGAFTTLYSFSGSEGAYPSNGLIQASDGSLYGAVETGGANGSGAVYKVTLPILPPVVSAPNPTGASTAVGMVGTAFSYQVVASNAPTSYAATGLPGGLSLNAAGLVSGTPTAAGTFAVVLSATNAGGTGTATLTLTVAPALPVVTLVAVVPQVTAGSGDEGEFAVVLSAAQDHDVFVNLVLRGSAVNGTDYQLLKTTKKIKAGHASKLIHVVPLGSGAGAGGKRTLTLTLGTGEGYQVGTTGQAKVKIYGQ